MLDLVPQSGVRVDDISVGKVTDVELKGWHAVVTLQINGDTRLPDDAEATIRQTSLLGEKFVSIAPPEDGGTGRLSNGDVIPLERSGKNPELEEILSAAALLFNGGGLEKTNTIVRELNLALEGNEPEIKALLKNSESFFGVLDDNKQAILTALEKIDRLSVATLNQRKSITQALDDIPPALKILDKQRDDLVAMLKAFDRLSGVATSVIRRSKDDTLTDLRRLEPVLRELANAGDSIANAFTLLTYPFPDSLFGGIEGPCPLFRAMTPAHQPARRPQRRVLRRLHQPGHQLGDERRAGRSAPRGPAVHRRGHLRLGLLSRESASTTPRLPKLPDLLRACSRPAEPGPVDRRRRR